MRYVLPACLGALTVVVAACSGGDAAERSFQADAGSVPGEFVDDASVPVDGAPPASTSDVEVVITADNAYAFGWGDENGPRTLFGRPKTVSSNDIFSCPINSSGSGVEGYGPEAYVIPAKDAPESDYLYIAAWDDDRITQGVLGQFERKGGVPVYSGAAEWQVCATGKVYDSNEGSPTAGGPPIDVVRSDVGTCNRGDGSRTTSSAGWVNVDGAVTARAQGVLAVGEDNSSDGDYFDIACQKEAGGKRGIDPAAKWMWYTPDSRDAFSARGTLPYLIFRLPVKELPPVR